MPNHLEESIRGIDVTINSLNLKKANMTDKKEIEDINFKIEQLKNHRKSLMDKYGLLYPMEG